MFTIANNTINIRFKYCQHYISLDPDLSWSLNLDHSIARSRHIVHRLKYLREWLNLEELTRLVSSQYFSIIFYNAPLWIGSLDAASWKKLNSVHYRALRMELGDFRSIMKSVEIDWITMRATPIEWASYSIASTVIRLYNQSDTRITEELVL